MSIYYRKYEKVETISRLFSHLPLLENTENVSSLHFGSDVVISCLISDR